MRRTILVILLMTGIALAACTKKSSLYMDSGRSEASEPAQSAAPATAPAPAPPKAPAAK